MSDSTEEKQPAHLFKPGQSGNPAGRPKGTRNKLSEAFISALSEDFEANGQTVIAKVRTEKPSDYLKVIASIVPKQLEVKDNLFDDMTDEQLAEVIAVIAAARNAVDVAQEGDGGTATAH